MTGRRSLLSRRALIGGIGAGTGLLLSGCDRLNESDSWRRTLRLAEQGNEAAQRALTARMALAREFDPHHISRKFPENGTRRPQEAGYQAMVQNGFADWSLKVDGLVEKRLALPLGQLRQMPSRNQITRHDCVEGWSAIGKWTGVPLSHILDLAGLMPKARYLVFHCADRLGGVPYYESIDLIDARHPQTILAWALNDQMLPVGHGAPLRLRVERQLGYKHAKYVMRIEAVERLTGIYGGRGGYWEDVADYEWYAGI
ncbi:MAG: molybdopterin-dependent oxidoreductase [Blastomonas sp.]